MRQGRKKVLIDENCSDMPAGNRDATENSQSYFLDYLKDKIHNSPRTGL